MDDKAGRGGTLKWRIDHYPEGSFSYGGEEVWEVVEVIDGTGYRIAACYTQSRAEQIIADHEAVEVAIEALEQIADSHRMKASEYLVKWAGANHGGNAAIAIAALDKLRATKGAGQ